MEDSYFLTIEELSLHYGICNICAIQMPHMVEVHQLVSMFQFVLLKLIVVHACLAFSFLKMFVFSFCGNQRNFRSRLAYPLGVLWLTPPHALTPKDEGVRR